MSDCPKYSAPSNRKVFLHGLETMLEKQILARAVGQKKGKSHGGYVLCLYCYKLKLKKIDGIDCSRDYSRDFNIFYFKTCFLIGLSKWSIVR